MERPKSCGQLAYTYGFSNIILFSEKLKMGLRKKEYTSHYQSHKNTKFFKITINYCNILFQ